MASAVNTAAYYLAAERVCSPSVRAAASSVLYTDRLCLCNIMFIGPPPSSSSATYISTGMSYWTTAEWQQYYGIMYSEHSLSSIIPSILLLFCTYKVGVMLAVRDTYIIIGTGYSILLNRSAENPCIFMTYACIIGVPTFLIV